jgi:hypothetical protein
MKVDCMIYPQLIAILVCCVCLSCVEEDENPQPIQRDILIVTQLDASMSTESNDQTMMNDDINQLDMSDFYTDMMLDMAVDPCLILGNCDMRSLVCRLQSPLYLDEVSVNERVSIYGRLNTMEVVDDIMVQVGFGTLGSFPDDRWIWVEAYPHQFYDQSEPNYTEYLGYLSSANAGEYSFAFRVLDHQAQNWIYCDHGENAQGSLDGYRSQEAGYIKFWEECESGFIYNEQGVCIDENECLDNNGGCDINAMCQNQAGTERLCICNPGYEGDGIHCSNPQATSLRSSYIKATHNSYEGGDRRSIIDQLNAGVRGLEFDIHDNDFRNHGYRLGHLTHNDAVDNSGDNPDQNALNTWLHHVSDWSQDHRGHAPILLTIDLKDNLKDNRNFAEGNLAHLNQVILAAFPQIWLANQSLEDIEVLYDHVLCILSGDQGTRRAYLYDAGTSPAVAVNVQNQILEVHDSGTGDLWYWGGRLNQNLADRVVWKRHGRYDSGRRGSILLSPQGHVIEVHQSESRDQLWAMVGSMTDEGELTLNDASRFSDGTFPTLAWARDIEGASAADNMILLRYRKSGNFKQRRGTVNFNQKSISWSSESNASDEFEKSVSSHNGRRISVDQSLRVPYPVGSLWIDIGGVTTPIRYQQICFVEWQRSEYQDDVLGLQDFGAVPAGDYENLSDAIRSRYIIRSWEFNASNASGGLIPQMPATDHPFRNNYQDLMNSVNALE